jgi:hypothetical protein
MFFVKGLLPAVAVVLKRTQQPGHWPLVPPWRTVEAILAAGIVHKAAARYPNQALQRVQGRGGGGAGWAGGC